MVTALIFNPKPEVEHLALSYLDGELALLDPFQDETLASFHANCHTLTSSPDGRLLAACTGSGLIKICEFNTLNLLYQVKSPSYYIKQLAFSRDGLRFADIRDSQRNVWEPAALLRTVISGNSSDDTSTSFIEAVPLNTKVKVSAIDVSPKGDFVLCGEDDRSVSIYEVKCGNWLGKKSPRSHPRLAGGH